MEYRRVGGTGLRTSPIALGTMNFGPVTPEAEAQRIMSAAAERGVNLFDTADVYGADANRTISDNSDRKGATEEIIGRWLAGSPARREQILLVTKAYGRMGEGPNDMHLSARHLRRACEASLRRLNTDVIDVFMLHHVDRDTSWDEIWEALDDLRRAGKIRYAGTSNFPGWKLVQGQEAARRRNLLGLVLEESIYNLMEHTIELELLPACREYGIGVLPYSPLNSGLLGGILSKGDGAARTASSRATGGLAARRPQLERFEKFCHEIGRAPAVLAQAWLLHRPGITASIVGARTMGHLEDGLEAATLALTGSELDELDRIFPGPGAAPEAYAW